MSSISDAKAWKHFRGLFPTEAKAMEDARKLSSEWFDTMEGRIIFAHWEAYRMGYQDGKHDYIDEMVEEATKRG